MKRQFTDTILQRIYNRGRYDRLNNTNGSPYPDLLWDKIWTQGWNDQNDEIKNMNNLYASCTQPL